MFVFVDIETGDLPTNRSIHEIPILEIGIVITDDNLQEQSARSWVVHHPKEVLDAMDEWCIRVHAESGLTQASLEATQTMEEVEEEICTLYQPLLKPDPEARLGLYCMGGSSVHFDRQFIQEKMPRLNSLFHFRNIDVSSMRETCKVWGLPILEHEKDPDHRVLGDLRNTIRELSFFRDHYFKV